MEGWRKFVSKHVVVRLLGLIVVLVVMGVHVCDANAWWDEKWQHRRKIVFNSTQTGADIAETVNEVPVLIRLHSGNFNFSNAKEDGSDVRFVGGDDKTPLKFHKELFDPLLEMGLFWVKVPRIPGSSNSEAVWLYYGNKSAVGGEDKPGTFDVNTVAVYHFDEKDGPPKDATAYANNASQFEGGNRISAVIGSGVALTGAGERVVIPHSPSLNFSNGFSASAWVKISQPQYDGCLFSWGDDVRKIVVGIDQARPYCRIAIGPKGVYETPKNFDLSLDSWHHLAVSAKPSDKIVLYVDGVEAASAPLPVSVPEIGTDMAIGATLRGENPLSGEADEFRLYKTAIPAGVVKAAFTGEGADGGLYGVGEEEAGEGGESESVVYMRMIVKNLSLDGWAVIIFLWCFGFACTFVFFRKFFTLMVMEKENRNFMEFYEKVDKLFASDGPSGNSDPDDPEEEIEGYSDSSLYKVYSAGEAELKKWAKVFAKEGGEVKHLSPQAIKAVSAAIDRAFIKEHEKLNAGIVLFNMAITGGPFIGLFGTVWGVMNTFAAMAVAGEANLTAIAPGIASALAATLNGLFLAIPALFSYNYLVARIKNILVELNLFVDELSIRIEGTYGGGAQ